MSKFELKLPGAIADVSHPNYVGPPYDTVVSPSLINTLNAIVTGSNPIETLRTAVKHQGISWEDKVPTLSGYVKGKTLVSRVSKKMDGYAPVVDYTLGIFLADKSDVLKLSSRIQDPSQSPASNTETLVILPGQEEQLSIIETRDYSSEEGWERPVKGEVWIPSSQADVRIINIARTALANFSLNK